MSIKNNQIKELELKIAEYNLLIEQGEETKEVRSMRWWIEREARELGYVFATDKNFD